MRFNKTLHLYAKFAAGATFFLIIAGGLVTSTGSGLAVPDWPLSFGTLFPAMEGGVLFEHGHRMIAGFVGFVTLALMIWFLAREPRRWVRRLSVFALIAVVMQAILGGMTVLMKLPTPVSVSHACLAQTFFCLMVTLALVTGKGWFETSRYREPEGGVRLGTLAGSLFILVFFQLVLGAFVRHMGAGLAIPDFPLSYGYWIPPFTARNVQIHFAHRVGAVLILFMTMWILARVLRRHRDEPLLRGPALFLSALVLFQITLGALTIWTLKSVPVVTAHVAVGALVLVTAWVLVLRTRSVFTAPSRKPSAWRDYLVLTKPRLTLMVLMTTVVGFVLASGQSFRGGLFFWTVFGTLLVAAGSQALNQYLEREVDAIMGRTCARPLPAGRMMPYQALRFGVMLSGAGLVILAGLVHPLSGLAAFVTLASYLFAYTPLKKKTSLCTLVGAIPGALPPMIGWAAVRGTFDIGAWALFAILFVWQIPHFLSLSWIYRGEYRAAGLVMLAVSDSEGRSTRQQVLLWSVALLPVSLFPAFLGLAGGVYFVGALVLGLGFLGMGLSLVRLLNDASARKTFLSSVVYLSLLLMLIVADKGAL